MRRVKVIRAGNPNPNPITKSTPLAPLAAGVRTLTSKILGMGLDSLVSGL